MTKKMIMLTSLLLAFMAIAVNAQEEGSGSVALQASNVEVQSPDRLQGTLSHRGALFGKIPFGRDIKKNLYYTKRPLCNGQLPDTPDYIKSEGYFLLVDRGGCSFVEKIRNAQRDNATAVLIADNTCLCSIEGSCEADQECEEVEPTMDDDGSGVDIQIPSLLLFKPDADRLRQELVSGTMIEMSISFQVPKAENGHTQYTLWSTPDDLMSHQFLSTFYDAAIGFGNKASFNPRMLVKDGQEKGCRQHDESHIPCEGFCTNYGRYCEPRSYYDTDSYDQKGTKMVVESLRRACIWNIYGADDGIGREWWSYVEMWMLECSHSHYSTSCAEGLFQVAGIDKEDLETCMMASGNFRLDVTNDLMEKSLVDASKYNVQWAPRLYVNGALIEGSLTYGTAVEAICSTFDESEMPEICNKWSICASTCDKDATCILWGNDSECGEYRAPFLSNDDKQYDDDYVNTETTDSQVTDAPTVALDPPPTDTPTSTSTETSILTLSPSLAPTKRTSPPSTTPVSAPVTAPIFLPAQPSASNFMPHSDDPNDHPTGQSPTNAQGASENQEVTETIQIYEGSNGFAIGIGVGIGCMVIFTIIFVLICRDRQARHQLEELTIANMSNALPRGDWSAASRSRYVARPPPTVGHYMEDSFYDEGEDYYYDSGYPPPPRRGRARFGTRGMGARSFAGRFARPTSVLEEEDQEIEALVAQHFREQKLQQQQRLSGKNAPLGGYDDNMQVEDVVKLPSTRRMAEPASPSRGEATED